MLNPGRKHPVLPGSEDSVGAWCPCWAGPGLTDGFLSPWAILLSCLFQNRFCRFWDSVSFSAEARKANHQGLKGELAGPRAGGGAGSLGEDEDRRPGWTPKLVQTHTGAAYFQRFHSVTHNEFSSPASWWNWRMWIKPVLLITWFWCGSLEENVGIKTICICWSL